MLGGCRGPSQAARKREGATALRALPDRPALDPSARRAGLTAMRALKIGHSERILA
jgi:hypothetical protein